MRSLVLTNLRLGLMSITLIVLLMPSVFGVESGYKDYKPSTRQEKFFEISFDKKKISIGVFDNEKKITAYSPRKSIVISESQVLVADSVWFDKDGLVFDRNHYLYKEISDSRITDNDGLVTITFFTQSDTSRRTGRVKLRNRISFADNSSIGEDEFVRGIVFAVTGNIEAYGEVNGDIISLFGDVYVGPGAVARGDVASVFGRIEIAKGASVYGEIYEGQAHRVRYRHRFYQHEKTISFTGNFKYNRVDGATPSGGVRFDDRDSLLPSFWATGGYAFKPERWRYDIGLEQTIWRRRPLVIGGSYYRRLASEDDWLLSDGENIIFTLLVTEDFKDYYEAEGGAVYSVFKPFPTLNFEGKYRLERTRWMNAYPRLWSLFGGDKLFRENFSQVETDLRQRSIVETDSTENAYLVGQVEFDTRNKDNLFEKSAWHLIGDIEWSHPGLSSDFDYRRYTITLSRYQKIHPHAMLLWRSRFGNSDGYLPMYKRFFIGGLGTLRGYKHKEFMGTRFWMANVEYRIDFPGTDIATALFWDGGQIANQAKLGRDIEVKHSIGIAFFLGNDLRINLSKRLDRSYDDGPKIYVRFNDVF